MPTCLTLSPRTFLRIMVMSCTAGLLALVPHRAAEAQEIILSANGDPITSVDLEQRMKLLRAFRKPATREAATESMIEDRLKEHEALHMGIIIKDNEIGEDVQNTARRMKVTPTVLLQNIAKSGVSNEHIRNYFKAHYAFSILVRALNRGVEASEIAVRDELAKEKDKGGITSYTIRQIVFTLNPGDPPSVVESSVKQAQALRTRFTSCESGIPYAKTLPSVAIRKNSRAARRSSATASRTSSTRRRSAISQRPAAPRTGSNWWRSAPARNRRTTRSSARRFPIASWPSILPSRRPRNTRRCGRTP